MLGHLLVDCIERSVEEPGADASFHPPESAMSIEAHADVQLTSNLYLELGSTTSREH